MRPISLIWITLWRVLTERNSVQLCVITFLNVRFLGAELFSLTVPIVISVADRGEIQVFGTWLSSQA